MTTRREQVREAIARHRKRRKRGFFWRPILVTKAQLDQLEERGYLNPSDRGTRADECEAIARPNPPFASPSHRAPVRKRTFRCWWVRQLVRFPNSHFMLPRSNLPA